jgi:prevent-host-death family protein
MTRISIAEARDRMSDVLNRAIYKNEQFALTRHGQTVAVLLSVEEARSLGLKVEDAASGDAPATKARGKKPSKR